MTPPITVPGHPAAGNPRTENHYCATCRSTRAFADRGAVLDCPLCRHRLHRLLPLGEALGMGAPGGPGA